MQRLDDQEPLVALADENANTIDAQYEADKEKVNEVIDEWNAHENNPDRQYDTLDADRHEIIGDGEEDHHAVPTELLTEDIDAYIELSPHFRTGRVANFIADAPKRVTVYTAMLSFICLIWVLLTPGERFSVADELFEAQGTVNYKHWKELGYLQYHDNVEKQQAPGYVYPQDRHHGWGRRLAAGGGEATGVASAAPPGVRRLEEEAPPREEKVTLVYERRGMGSRNVLSLRQLKVIHDFESELWDWMIDEGVCWKGGGGGPESQGCQPLDSIMNYLYPYVETGAYLHDIRFDGRMPVEGRGECADPPFASADVSEPSPGSRSAATTASSRTATSPTRTSTSRRARRCARRARATCARRSTWTGRRCARRGGGSRSPA